MRKHDQRKILDSLQTLREANAELLEQMSAPLVFEGLLANCQEFSMAIADFIKGLAGEKVRCVSLITEYCGLLSRSGDNGNGIDCIKKLGIQLTQIENMVKQELKPDKIEILFLPYKYSMADSMESIWLAAIADPQCDVYICPIPYYDRLPDRSFGEMHYEGASYPKNLPLVDWQNYDLEDRRPDVIFIHNPYDEGNFVTSVHPDFYSKRLKDFTDLLCYVPYFVCNDDIIEEHFAICAGTIYADKVFVQSQKIRSGYIDYFKKFAKKNNLKDTFGNPDNKFVALGSPKFDAVFNAKRKDFALPEEWAALISDKKVLFYNTSISALLHGSEHYLAKLRNVLEILKSRDDIALWWRPHPLNKTTYQSMRPHLLRQYEEIIEDYRREGWGIYDDTPYLHRAIAYSDAYYGDGSSLIALFVCAGKPIMIQNEYLTYNCQTVNRLFFIDLYDDGESFWFTAIDYNALFKMDKHTWETEYMGSFPNEKMSGYALYSQIARHKSKLYFSPYLANEIAVYDTESKQFEKICFIERTKKNQAKAFSEPNFQSVVVYEKYVFFVGGSYPAILRYDTESGKIDYFRDWVQNLSEKTNNKKNAFLSNVCTTDNKIVAPVYETNAIVVFDMRTCLSNVYEVGRKDFLFWGCCYDGKCFWTHTAKEKRFIRWDMNTYEYTEYADFPGDFSCDETTFFSLVFANGYVWAFAFNDACAVLKINPTDGRISFADEFSTEFTFDGKKNGYSFATAYDDSLYAIRYMSNGVANESAQLVAYNCQSNKKLEDFVLLSQNDREAMMRVFLTRLSKNNESKSNADDCVIYENLATSIFDYLLFVCKERYTSSILSLQQNMHNRIEHLANNCDGTTGAKILQYIKNNSG